jgi:hypothetical protein
MHTHTHYRVFLYIQSIKTGPLQALKHSQSTTYVSPCTALPSLTFKVDHNLQNPWRWNGRERIIFVLKHAGLNYQHVAFICQRVNKTCMQNFRRWSRRSRTRTQHAWTLSRWKQKCLIAFDILPCITQQLLFHASSDVRNNHEDCWIFRVNIIIYILFEFKIWQWNNSLSF